MPKNKIERINLILLGLEKDLKKISLRLNSDLKDQICQEIRIKLWRFIDNRFSDLLEDPDYDTDDENYIAEFCKPFMNSTMTTYCSMIIFNKHQKYNKRHVNIESLETEDRYDSFRKDWESDLNKVDFEIDFSKYKEFLSDKQYKLLKYIVDTGNPINNFDALSREFGYTAKGSAKYNLEKIAQKIQTYNQNLLLSGVK